MKYSQDSVLEVKGILWSVEDGLIKFTKDNETLVFNESLTIVWKKIDGISTIHEICMELYEDYKDQQSLESIESAVESCIDILLEEDLVLVKEADEFGGWFDYD